MARDERGSDLASRLLARDRSAVPDALNLVDDDRPAERAQARVLFDRLELSGGAFSWGELPDTTGTGTYASVGLSLWL